MYRFSGFELDPARQELRRAGDVIHVEPQVFDLLVLLIEHRDRIVSKDEILDTIWDGRIVSEAALSSRINAARKAIGDSGNDQALIRTFHKRGFRFVGEVEAQAGAAPEPTPAAAAPHPPNPAGRPSIAVAPFSNLSDNPEHDFFSYGLTEDIIRLLARNRWLKVLSRHTLAPMISAKASVTEIGASLGVRYIVQGSVRRAGERVRITAELVSAADGEQLWSESYDIELPDIFDIQNAMAEQIAAMVEPELGSIERESAARKPPDNLDAWECFQRGFWHLWGFTNPGFAQAESLFARAASLDPGFARAHAALSYVHLQQAFYGDVGDRERRLSLALDLGRTAVALDSRDCLCRCVLGRALCMLQRYDEAVEELEATVSLNPSFAQGFFALAFTLIWTGRQDEAVALLERAADLSPRDPHLWTFLHVRALAHLTMDEFRSAEHFARLATRQPNATHWPHSTLTATLGLSGQREAAAEALQDLLQKAPGYSEKQARDDFFFCSDEAFVSRYVEGLRRAGLNG
jgi:TolB-like protein/cytochrome c-type biogenesis protein CcmH/NrfG